MNINNFPKSDHTLTLPDGYMARPFVMDDLEPVVVLLNRVSQKQYGKDRHKLEDVRNEWTEPNFTLEKDSLGIWTDAGDLVGYLELWRSTPERMFVWIRIDPMHDTELLGGYLLTWAEQQARADMHKVPNGVQVVLHGANKSEVPEVDALYATNGYEIVRYMYLMRIDMQEEPEPVMLPEGFSFRAYNHPEDLETLVQADRDGFRDHWGWVDTPFETELAEFRHWFDNDELQDPTMTVFAVDDATGDIAGVNMNRLEQSGDSEVGYVETLAVLRGFRKRGLGNALLRWGFRELYLRGKKSVTLHVDASSLTGALRLYENAGMRVVESSTRYEKVLREGVSRMTTTVDKENQE